MLENFDLVFVELCLSNIMHFSFGFDHHPSWTMVNISVSICIMFAFYLITSLKIYHVYFYDSMKLVNVNHLHTVDRKLCIASLISLILCDQTFSMSYKKVTDKFDRSIDQSRCLAVGYSLKANFTFLTEAEIILKVRGLDTFILQSSKNSLRTHS